MTEENDTTAAPEINYHANIEACEAIPQSKRLVTNIGFTAKVLDKYEVYFLVPETEEEAKSRYDCSLASLVEMGVRQISTRIDYKSVGFEENGELKEGGHEAMQEMADGYRVGARKEGTAKVVKQKAAKLDNLEAKAIALGYESLEAMIADME